MVKAKYWATAGLKACQICGSRQNLQVHHLDYTRFGGKELVNDLMGTCFTCHNEIHKFHRQTGGSLRNATLRYKIMYSQKRYRLYKKKRK